MSEMHDPYEDQLAAARYRAERDQARQELARLGAERDRERQELVASREYAHDMEDENERLRDMLNDVAWKLGIGHVVHYNSEDNYQECHERVLDEISKLTGPTSYDVAQVTTSAYDLLPEEDREALRWVRGQGGLDEVIRDFQDAYNRRTELCAALGIDPDTGWSDAMAELDRRLMPEGMKWPMYESGEPVRIGDVVSDVEVRSIVFRDDGILLSDCTSVPGWGTWRSYKEPIKRPAPKVLDADGVEIHVGDTVYHVKDGSEMTVYGIEGEWLVVSARSRARHDTVTHRAPVLAADGEPLREGEHVYHVENGTEYEVCEVKLPRVTVEYWCAGISAHSSIVPNLLTHRAPVLAAEGWPLHEGETVWSVKDGTEYRVVEIRDTTDDDGEPCKIIGCANDELHIYCAYFPPDKLTHTKPEIVTHTKPEIDTWKRLEEDVAGASRQDVCCANHHIDASDTSYEWAMARDIVRRCKELARKENNNE